MQWESTKKIHREKKKDQCHQCAYFLHFQCVGVVCGSVGVLDILQNNVSLLARLVDDLRDNKQEDQIRTRPLVQQQPNRLLLTSIVVLSFS